MAKISLPTLYKCNSDGSTQFWTVSIRSVCECEYAVTESTARILTPEEYDQWSSHSDGDDLESAGEIISEYGQVGTDKPQCTSELVFLGKNVGRKNATTAYQQAQKEAQSKWDKQSKKGYVIDLEKAKAGADDIGGYLPMLAEKFEDFRSEVTYPCYVQPKLDGIRCIAIVTHNSVRLFSRTRKEIRSCPHVVKALAPLQEYITPGQEIALDGELYNHSFKTGENGVDFEKIVSLVRQQEPGEGHELIQYHLYDLVKDASFSDRLENLSAMMIVLHQPAIKLVPTLQGDDESGVRRLHDEFVDAGYEGCMVRLPESNYAGRRSRSLLKLKMFRDEDFPILSVREGKGRMSGCAIFLLETNEGKTFESVIKGSLEYRKQLFQDPNLWTGKSLTVQFQNWTKERIPRFPVGVAIRDYE